MKNLILSISFLFFTTCAFSQDWLQTSKLDASNRAQFDELGNAVAISGSYAVVGAKKEDYFDNTGLSITESGSAYIYEKGANGIWTEVKHLEASSKAGLAHFGSSVAIEGNFLLVGAERERRDENNLNSLNRAGAVYAFERNTGGQWVEVQKIVPSDRGALDLFGMSVSISGNWALITAASDNEGTAGMSPTSNAGSAYFFEKDATGVWVEKQKVVANVRGKDDYFGYSGSLSGTQAIIGTASEGDDENEANFKLFAGSAYIFELNNVGAWEQVQKLVASDRSAEDRFGWTCSIDANTALVGATNWDEKSAGSAKADVGAAYIFEKNSSGNWIEKQIITINNADANDALCSSVDINGDYAILSSVSQSTDGSGQNVKASAGAAYILKKQGNGQWGVVEKIVASDRGASDIFGVAAAVDSTSILVGARKHDFDSQGANNVFNAGAAYVFELNSNFSVNENNSTSNISIYPNPAQSEISLDFGKIYPEIEVSVISLNGQVILQMAFGSADKISIDIDGAKGVYFLKVKSKGELLKTAKVFKE